MSIPPDLSHRLYTTLLNCSPCDTDQHLRTLFVDARLAPWRAKIPEAETMDRRVRNLIAALYPATHRQDNGLVLLLRVLQEQHAPQTECHQRLGKLAADLEALTRAHLPDTPEWDRALDRYLDLVRTRYRQIQIFGQSRPSILNDIFTDVYVLAQPQAFRRHNIHQLRADPDRIKKAERIDGLDILARAEGNRLFILGKPGAGKTTFLKYLALRAADRQSANVPIFIELKQWADSGADLLDYIQRPFAQCSVSDPRAFVVNLLQSGRALVLCDGLDEVSTTQEQRTQIIRQLKAFIQMYPTCQFLITCRNAATDYTFTGFTYVEMADFDDEQIRAFADKWFAGEPAKRDAFLEALASPDHRSFRELGSVPLLLTMLCLAFDVNLEFPQRRVEIYADALDALLRKWDSSRNIKRDLIYRGLSTGRKHQLFARIAAETFGEGLYFIPQQRLEKQIVAYLQRLPHTDQASDDIDGHVVLNAIEAQHGIFVERAHRIYTFAHLTFQEYYTARYTVQNARRGTLSRLLTHVTEPRWREVILLTASLLDEADDFFAHFLDVLAHQVQATPKLHRLLTWADGKASHLSDEASHVILRHAYCLLALDFARDHPHIRSQALNLILALDRDETFFSSTTRLPARSRRPSQRAHGDLPADLVLDNLLSRLLHRAQTLVRARDHNLIAGGMRDLAAVMNETLHHCRTTDNLTLYEALAKLELPTTESPPRYYQKFTQSLQALLEAHRDLRYEWALSPTQAQALMDYFYSAELLIRCLDLAYVTDRARIETSLPPRAV